MVFAPQECPHSATGDGADCTQRAIPGKGLRGVVGPELAVDSLTGWLESSSSVLAQSTEPNGTKDPLAHCIG